MAEIDYVGIYDAKKLKEVGIKIEEIQRILGYRISRNKFLGKRVYICLSLAGIDEPAMKSNGIFIQGDEEKLEKIQSCVLCTQFFQRK